MRKSISVAFFSLVSTLMVLGIVLMGASEWVLFKNYFAKDRYETLDQVECVSWKDCQTFIRNLYALTGKNFRLPTEAEWEFAARGGNNSRGYKYAGSDNIGDVAWYKDNSGKKTHVVGTKLPNELGIYDMSGNVWEWCQDWYGGYSNIPQKNPKGPNGGKSGFFRSIFSHRVLRGGSWYDDAWYCRSSRRNYYSPGYRGINFGLRLVLSHL